jgi:hypothetical protein
LISPGAAWLKVAKDFEDQKRKQKKSSDYHIGRIDCV